MAASQPSDNNATSEPTYTQLNTNDLPWYTEDIGAQLTPKVYSQPCISGPTLIASQTRALLETYSAIPSDQVIPHIHAVRKKLWDRRAYPCTGLFVFLVPWIEYHSAFSSIVARLKPSSSDATASKFLDVGSYIGHDLRALHIAGVPQSSLFGLDIVPFWDLGWELFNDTDKFGLKEGKQLIMGDILDTGTTSAAATLLDGKMSVVWVSAVLHQFNWTQGVAACKRLVRFTCGPGAIIAGAQVGSKESQGKINLHGMAGRKELEDDKQAVRHSCESMRRMWEAVGEELGTKLEVEASWKGWRDFGCEEERCKFMGADMGVLEFTVRLL